MTYQTKRPPQPLLMDLFPEREPYSSGFLAVQEPHNLYWEQSGNPDGEPIVFLHGGPGAGTTPTHRRFFDPKHYRIIVFDQRGCGKSQPLASLENNTAAHLVKDLEMLRIHLKIDKWHIFGGSWGSTLALHYATSYPDHVKSMILRGIFLCEQREIDWFFYGMRKIFPQAWEQFAAEVDDDEHDDLLNAYYKRLTSEDKKVQTSAAVSWALYESACSSLIPNYEILISNEQKLSALCLARLEAHFFKHEVIAPEDSLLNKIDLIRHIPATIIQGRYDIVCPIETADTLHHAWKEAEYTVVPDAGHSALDPTLLDQLVKATEFHKKYT